MALTDATTTGSGPTIGETARRVRAARAYCGLTASALAEQLGMGVQTIKRIEAGRRSVRPYEVIAIAEACGLPRAFFEVPFGQLASQADRLDARLDNVDSRLERIEQRLAHAPGARGVLVEAAANGRA